MEVRRRGFLLGALAGTCARAGDKDAATTMRMAISPPGSNGGKSLRTRCIGCGLCVAKCPTKVLKAATLEYGIAGVMMPVMDFSRGYCDKDCTLCGEVCPTGAIRCLTKNEKAKAKIGQAVLASGWETACLAYKEGHACALCEKHCPYGAVKVIEEMQGKKKVRRPVVDVAKCVGCGACVHVCPVRTLFVCPGIASPSV